MYFGLLQHTPNISNFWESSVAILRYKFRAFHISVHLDVGYKQLLFVVPRGLLTTDCSKLFTLTCLLKCEQRVLVPFSTGFNNL